MVTVPVGGMTGCITIEEWSGLDPGDAHEAKVYCPGIGNVSGGGVGSSDRYVLTSRTP